MSDNGPQFVSEEFQSFLKAKNVKHLRSAPYYLSSKGLAESFVWTFKKALKASDSLTIFSLETYGFLLSYLNNSTLYYRSLTSSIVSGLKCLYLSGSHLSKCLWLSVQLSCYQKKYHDAQIHSCDFFVGQKVYASNYHGGSKWVPETLVACWGPLSFVIQVNDGVQWHHHVDQLVESPDSPQDCSSSHVSDTPDLYVTS